MSPRRAHRRARRRSSARPVVLIVAAAVVLALIIGGLTQVSRQSQRYDAGANRTLAAQGAIVADESNATARDVRTFVADLPSQSRQVLQADLDSAVDQTADQSSSASVTHVDSAPSTLTTEFADVFTERARAVVALRAAVDGMLGLRPVPAAGGAAASSVPVTSSTPTLSATQASNRIAAAGALLTRSDALYRSVRRALAAADGHGRLPTSVWVSDPQDWQAGTVAANVDLIATSSSLLATHYLVIRTIRYDPAPLPTPPGTAANVAVISPVSHFGVSVVLANEGTVAEPQATVHVSLVDQKTTATQTRSVRSGLALGSSVALPEVHFAVKPGNTYVLDVAVVLPPGQTNTIGTATQQTLEIAPAT